ncbi:MAG: YesL family protein [Lachnospiraceae bacterium]|nr:YesL family protein [Lachnospiraceae bacterium]
MKTWLDKKVFVFLAGIVDVLWISLLWYISSIFVFTAGCAMSSMYYTVHTRIFKGEGYIFPTYKKAFLDNFRKATLIWIIFILLDSFLIFDFLLAAMAVRQGSALAFLYYPVLVCIVIALMWQLSAFAYQARFEDSVRSVLVKSAYIAFTNIGWMIFLTAILAGLIVLCRYLIIIVVLLPGGYTCLLHYVFEHICKKAGWIEEDPAKD